MIGSSSFVSPIKPREASVELMGASVELREVSVGYRVREGERVVARGIDLSLKSGELTCLLGANGVGKSTLLKSLSGFLPLLGGEIFINGIDLGKMRARDLSKVVGVVLTERCTVPNMTVYEMVATGRSPYTGFWGGCSPRDYEFVRRAIEITGISHLTDRVVDRLSDGERQKVMIAKVLAQQTPIIFLDEPTAFLDFPSKVEIMKLLNRISREEGKSVFMSTHDLELALQIADRVWLMDDRGVRGGTPEDLSLGGELSSFFANRGISFDMESGLFRVTNSYSAGIRLTGHGQKYAMARKALQRNGVEASRGVISPNVIDCGNLSDRNFIIQIEGELPYVAESIDSLLGYTLAKIFPESSINIISSEKL